MSRSRGKAGPELHTQVAAELRRAIADGETRPASDSHPQRISPPFSASTRTRPRALRELRDEGLLEFRRGRGISVAGSPERGAVIARTRELLDFARNQGYKPDELISIIQQLG